MFEGLSLMEHLNNAGSLIALGVVCLSFLVWMIAGKGWVIVLGLLGLVAFALTMLTPNGGLLIVVLFGGGVILGVVYFAFQFGASAGGSIQVDQYGDGNSANIYWGK